MEEHREPSAPGIDPRARFERQVRFAPLGESGQERLAEARVLLVGCGALGGSIAQTLVRSGVGLVRIVDRDVVEPSNLPRQVLFEDRHALARTPKVEAAAETLARIGGPSRIEAIAAHLDAASVAELAGDVGLVVDGTDNLATRYLLNDYCVEAALPWVYGGVVGGAGLVLAVVPGASACLRCLFPEPPPAGSLPTCDTAGVVLPAVAVVAALQAGLALRMLADPGGAADLGPRLLEVDAWNGRARELDATRDPDCPCCARGDRRFLEAATDGPVLLCGRGTVQLPRPRGRPDLARLAARLDGAVRDLLLTGPVLRFGVEELVVTVFADGRALVEGTEDVDRARAIGDRFLA